MKKKKLVKEALHKPELFSAAELSFFQRWLQDSEIENRKRNTSGIYHLKPPLC